MEDIKKKIEELERVQNITFPKMYFSFLEKIQEKGMYQIQETGITFYNYEDLPERNETYEVKEYEPNFFLIGQDGDLGFFINAMDSTDETIYSNDLGGIGSFPMDKEADNIDLFIEKFNNQRQ